MPQPELVASGLFQQPGSTPRRAISSNTWRPRSLGTGTASRISPLISSAKPLICWPSASGNCSSPSSTRRFGVVEFQRDQGLGDAGLHLAFDAGVSQLNRLLSRRRDQQRRGACGREDRRRLCANGPGRNGQQHTVQQRAKTMTDSSGIVNL